MLTLDIFTSVNPICLLRKQDSAHIISSLRSRTYRINAKHLYIEFCTAKYIVKGDIMNTNKSDLRESTIEFAIEISDLCDSISGCSVYTNQLIRCSSSIGANIYEAKYAQSRADFIHKLEISLKECYECEYWLELLLRKKKITDEQFKELKYSCGTIRRKLIASVTTAKRNDK